MACDGHARGAGADRLQMGGIVRLALRENAHRLSGDQRLRGRVEALQVAANLRGVVAAAKRGKHAQGPHDRPQQRNLEQRRFGQKSDRPACGNADQHRIDQRIGMVAQMSTGPLCGTRSGLLTAMRG